MNQFFKSQFSSFSATGVDFGSTIILYEFFKAHYLLCVSFGMIIGGVTNFLINRYWAFNAVNKSLQSQFMKYVLVWLGNFFLSVSFVYLFTEMLLFNYLVSKIVVAVVLGISFNYLLHKKYVFSNK